MVAKHATAESVSIGALSKQIINLKADAFEPWARGNADACLHHLSDGTHVFFSAISRIEMEAPKQRSSAAR